VLLCQRLDNPAAKREGEGGKVPSFFANERDRTTVPLPRNEEAFGRRCWEKRCVVKRLLLILLLALYVVGPAVCAEPPPPTVAVVARVDPDKMVVIVRKGDFELPPVRLSDSVRFVDSNNNPVPLTRALERREVWVHFRLVEKRPVVDRLVLRGPAPL
jgi:hypothetical protein